MSDVEIVARVERRREGTIEEKAALIAEVEAEGGKVKLVGLKELRHLIFNVTNMRRIITHDNVLYHAYLDRPKNL